MNYLIIYQNPFTGEKNACHVKSTESESIFNEGFHIAVIDLRRQLITFDGITWNDIEPQ